ncbi:MAG: zinc ABC transporter substrate-binding protein [Lachnospiraceae bacterium]|nr:zinc ABC transporter substrate-binding protein [Lachnospiraceae bacterium]
MISVIGLILVLCLSLGGCLAGGKNGPGDSGQNGDLQPDDDKLSLGNKLQVVTTIFPAYDFARQVGGEHAEVNMLLSPGEELHSYEPSPRDIIAIEQCDVFIYVGGESDTWVDDILESIDTSKTTIISMMGIVDALTEVTVEGMDTGGIWGGHSHDHGEEEHEDDHAEYDEHVWTSPANAKLIVEQIADKFVENDPENAQGYRDNEAAYVAELESLARELLSVRENAARTTIVVGDRFPYRYLAEFMDLDYFAAFPGCAEETEPSAKTVAFLIDKVKEEQIPVVFHGEFSSHLMAQRISEEAGAVPMLLHSCHNVTKAEFEAGVTYLDLMWENAAVLRAALCR